MKYFVSFITEGKTFGNFSMDTTNPINSMEDIREIEQQLYRQFGTKAVVLNYIILQK